jgi:hypothetical protein
VLRENDRERTESGGRTQDRANILRVTNPVEYDDDSMAHHWPGPVQHLVEIEFG